MIKGRLKEEYDKHGVMARPQTGKSRLQGFKSLIENMWGKKRIGVLLRTAIV